MTLIKRSFCGWALSIAALASQASGQGASGVRIGASPQSLSLEKAMDLAEAKSHGLRAATAAEDAASARVSETARSMGPKLGLEVNEVWFDKKTNKLVGRTLPNGTPVPDRVNTAGLTLTQPLTGLIALNAKERGDQRFADAASADRATTVREARTRAARAYIAVLKAAKFLDIANDSRKVIERQMSDAAKLKAEGKLAQLDYSRLEFASSEATTQVTDAEAGLQAAGVALKEILGMANDEAVEMSDLPPAHVPPLDASPGERPEVAAASARAQGTRDYQSAATADYWPSINAFAKYQRDFTAVDINAPNAQYDKEDIRDNLSYGLGMTWTIWDWNVRRGRSRELAAETARMEAMRDEAAAQTRVELAQAKAEVARAAQNQRNATVSSELSEKIFKATEVKFRNGLATTTDVLMSERDLTRARGGLANASYDLNLAVIQYRRALGQNP